MREKMMIVIVAINQLLLGFLWLAIGLSVIVTPLFVGFGLWGIVNAILLFFSGVISRITALGWHLIFIAYILVRFVEVGAFPESQRLIAWWAVVDVASVAYFSKVLFGYLRNRDKPQLGGSI